MEISKLSNLKKNIVQNNFAILCMNYPRYAVGDHYKDKEHKTCIDITKNENFNISKKIKIDDFIILRSDGSPTYMLSVVVDDHDMEVTHIIRGHDHLTNTFRQNVIYDSMKWKCIKNFI